MATQKNFVVKNGLTIQGFGEVIDSDGSVSASTAAFTGSVTTPTRPTGTQDTTVATTTFSTNAANDAAVALAIALG